MSTPPLLNINTLQYLAQLQAKVPNILNVQVGTFFERWPGYISKLEDAVKRGEFEAAAEILHKVKGHSGMLGFNAVQCLCDELEKRCRENCRDPNKTPCDTKSLNDCFQESWRKITEIIPMIQSLKPFDAPQ